MLAVIAGIFVGAHAMYEAWIYNVGEDIHSDGVIHWGYWLILGMFWFIPISSIVILLGLLTAGIVELWARLKGRQNSSK